MPSAEITLSDVGKSFGGLWAVRHVNLRIRRGEFFTLLGPSGCGKTTLLRMIAGFAVPNEGTIYFDGKPVNTVPPWHRDVGMVFQSYALWPHLNVFDHIAFGLRERHVPRRQIAERVRQALKQVGLEGAENRRPSQLSGGQQQRVALARTLAIQPRVLLLDEPLSNLDAKLRVDMRIELLKLQRDLGVTAVYVTHDQEEALALSTRIAVMNQGEVIQEGTPREIYEQPLNAFVAAFVGKANLFTARVTRATDGVIEVQTAEGMRFRIVPAAANRILCEGDSIIFSVRPEALEIAPLSESSSGKNRLAGQVTAGAYQGGHVEYEIRSGAATLTAHVTHPKGKPPFQRGDDVMLEFSPGDAVIISGV
jgi:ABC-type Fe3+/spermidine/putrescine transport system ATPase subunit